MEIEKQKNILIQASKRWSVQ